LRRAHRTGIGAGGGERVELIFLRQQQELLELLAEVAVARWVIERQRGEGIQHAVAAGLAPVAVSTPRMPQVFTRHLVLRGDLLERDLMIEPEARALADALGAHEVIAVFPPRRDPLQRRFMISMISAAVVLPSARRARPCG